MIDLINNLDKMIDNVSDVNEVIRDMEVGINDNGVLYVRIERTDLSSKYIKRICRSFENQGARVELVTKDDYVIYIHKEREV